MKKNTFYIIAGLAIIVIVCLVFINKKKKTESAWKPEFRDPKKEMRTMMGKGNYESIVGMSGQGY